MHLVLSIAAIVAAALAGEWLVDHSLGEARRYWVGIGGVALLVGSGALVQASGIDALTRTLRNAVIGAGIGAALKRTGLRLTWLRRGLRWVGVETEPERASEAGGRALPVSRVGGTLLGLGWAGTLVGIGLVWTGIFGG